MGGRGETNNNRDNEKVTIYPSEIHTYFYCPRMYFFETFIKKRRGFFSTLRLLIGRAFHFSFRLRDITKKFSYEVPLETSLGNVKIRGRPDAFRIDGNEAYIIERKSSKAPYRGAWASDVMQATAYGIIISREKEIDEIKIEIRYPTKKRLFSLDSYLVSNALKAISDMVLVKRYGIVPFANRGNRCKKCPYREECFLLDKNVEVELVEVGEWIKKISLLNPESKARETKGFKGNE
ncbi:MAG: CRISPR-associated protein Cas4 [Caldisphaeraceae archaeon]|nr:CRISPR-associated protein Cas4 [Caldisphaeraceae archaeon]MEB3692534.1 CRISPR-associated protein Cas4 [Caldisphaeraceae archaeon]MEB3798348.1 CRISPR-associated protein Cas4 [Caldisphaeraceae archaeon]